MAAASSTKMQFSEEEIRAKLLELGYNNIPDKALKEFSNDLHHLMSSEYEKKVNDGVYEEHLSPLSVSSTMASPNGSILYSYVQDTSFEKLPVTRHRQARSHLSVNKENQDDSIDSVSIRMTQKRKVLRKKNGKARVFDESFDQENAIDISDVEKQLQKLPLKDDSTTDSESIDDDMSERSSVLQPYGRYKNTLPSFIRPRPDQSYTTGIRKTDPVSRYHQFKQEWSSNKVPGEKSHKNLRWATREQMLHYEPIEKSTRSYTPNNYIAPTQKKRQALRWEVRSTLANY